MLQSDCIHIYQTQFPNKCKLAILSDQTLSDKWANLFAPGEEYTLIEKQLYLNLIGELFRYVVEHFLRFSLADRLLVFKKSILKRKRQALRADLASIPTTKSTVKKCNQS